MGIKALEEGGQEGEGGGVVNMWWVRWCTSMSILTR